MADGIALRHKAYGASVVCLVEDLGIDFATGKDINVMREHGVELRGSKFRPDILVSEHTEAIPRGLVLQSGDVVIRMEVTP